VKNANFFVENHAVCLGTNAMISATSSSMVILVLSISTASSALRKGDTARVESLRSRSAISSSKLSDWGHDAFFDIFFVAANGAGFH
jgi:hypothetical protein